MIGKTLGHYRILEKIGAGGMGEVYRAHDEQLDRDVALKVLPASSFADPDARARLLREARTASQLNHPHICTIHEVGEADGQAYIAMELVEGQALSALIPPAGLAAEQVLRHGVQLAEALAHAHGRGVVHRDLKSANVVITPEGRAKVLDFGLAKYLSEQELTEATTQSQPSLTKLGAVMGTLAYMAPEQLRGQPADARSDVWALGVVLYEMAAGQRPFHGDTSYDLSAAILREPPPALPGRVPVQLRAVIERCLEKESERRYQRGGELQAALEAIQTGTVAPWVAWRYRLSRHHALALAAVVLVLGAALAALDVGGLRTRLLGGAPQIASLAVLPLANLSGDPEQDYFADGMHEALITDLAKLSGLKRVIARSSVTRYKGTGKSPREIARELKVDVLITGAVLRSGDRVRITAQLINPTTEEQLWADRYERDLRDVLSLQNEIVAAITREINLRLTPEEQTRLARAQPVNPEAYEAYLRGKFYLSQFTPEGIEKGLEYLQQAVEKDPGNPLAWAGLALGYSLIGSHSPAAPPDAIPRAKEAALKALELDEMLAETHAALAQIELYNDWDWAGAEQAFRRALEINPNLAEAHAHYAWYLNLFGHQEEALAEMKRAQEVDPLEPIWPTWMGDLHWAAGQYGKAIEAWRNALKRFPDFPWALHMLGIGYAEMGMYKEAIAAEEKAVAANPDWKWALAGVYARAGRKEEARKIAAQLEEQSKTKAVDAFGLTWLYTTLGQKDKALRWAEVAYKSRHPFTPWFKSAAFKAWHGDPHFQDLLRRMNFPQ